MARAAVLPQQILHDGEPSMVLGAGLAIHGLALGNARTSGSQARRLAHSATRTWSTSWFCLRRQETATD